nr:MULTISPECIES: GNAT family N-acetyltransferase [Kribbella]
MGWRLSKDAWGNGYVTEATRASVDHAFGPAGWTRWCPSPRRRTSRPSG